MISVPTSVLGALARSNTRYRRRTPSVPAVASFLIGEGIDVYLVRYHECGVEAQTEMADDLILVGFILVFFKEIGGAGESDLV